MEIRMTLIGILWLTMSLLVFLQYGPNTKGIPTADKIMFVFICIIGGPIFTMAHVLEIILSYILPEGWDNDDI